MQIIRVNDVMKITGVSRTTLWRRVRDKGFPPPIKLGPTSVGWVLDEVENWLRERMDERDPGAA